MENKKREIVTEKYFPKYFSPNDGNSPQKNSAQKP
jgi:hypothetical protein